MYVKTCSANSREDVDDHPIDEHELALDQEEKSLMTR